MSALGPAAIPLVTAVVFSVVAVLVVVAANVGNLKAAVPSRTLVYLARRVAGDPLTYAGPLRRAARPRRAPGLGAATLVLALAGVCAMMSLIVAQRTREIGVRVVRAIVGRAAAQVTLGGLLGAALALFSLDLRSVLVSRLSEGGAWMLPAVLALLVAAGLAARWVPLAR